MFRSCNCDFARKSKYCLSLSPRRRGAHQHGLSARCVRCHSVDVPGPQRKLAPRSKQDPPRAGRARGAGHSARAKRRVPRRIRTRPRWTAPTGSRSCSGERAAARPRRRSRWMTDAALARRARRGPGSRARRRTRRPPRTVGLAARRARDRVEEQHRARAPAAESARQTGAAPAPAPRRADAAHKSATLAPAEPAFRGSGARDRRLARDLRRCGTTAATRPRRARSSGGSAAGPLP